MGYKLQHVQPALPRLQTGDEKFVVTTLTVYGVTVYLLQFEHHLCQPSQPPPANRR